MILIPVKNLSSAKQRLAAILDQPSRTRLAQAMLHDVLDCLASWENRPGVAVVTTDPFALSLATQFRFDVIPDHANRSETDAIEMATGVCEQRGIESTLVIPGDIPLIQPWELEKVLEAAPSEGSVLVPAADGRGTNAALRRPANLFPLRFGNDSFRPHLAAARATRKPCVVLSLAGIALDVDNPDELRRLAATPGNTRSQLLAREWDLTEFPLAANE
jgi:2-phospho-L-lactate guanylyltransferase